MVLKCQIWKSDRRDVLVLHHMGYNHGYILPSSRFFFSRGVICEGRPIESVEGFTTRYVVDVDQVGGYSPESDFRCWG